MMIIFLEERILIRKGKLGSSLGGRIRREGSGKGSWISSRRGRESGKNACFKSKMRQRQQRRGPRLIFCLSSFGRNERDSWRRGDRSREKWLGTMKSTRTTDGSMKSKRNKIGDWNSRRSTPGD